MRLFLLLYLNKKKLGFTYRLDWAFPFCFAPLLSSTPNQSYPTLSFLLFASIRHILIGILFLSLLLYIKGAIYLIIVFRLFSFKGLVYISLEGLWFALGFFFLSFFFFFPPFPIFLFSPPCPSSPLLISYDQIALSRSSSDRFLSASILVFFILMP